MPPSFASAIPRPAGRRGERVPSAFPSRPVRVRALYTRYPHWGAHAAMTLFADHLDPRQAVVTLQGVASDDSGLPFARSAAGRRVWDRVRRRVRARGMAWYTVNDLVAELRALPAALLGGVDVVHFLGSEHSAQYLPGAARRFGRAVRTVATYHQPPRRLGRLVNRRLASLLDLILVVSPTQLEWFRGVLPDDRVEFVPHGVDSAFFAPAADERARAEGDVFRCITVGHWLRDWRAARAVAERLAGERGVEFHVVTSRTTGLESLANVVHHRNVSDETLLALYRGAGALFLPLTDATANNALLEGMACGLPVVSTDLESVRAYVTDAAAALVERNVPNAFADALLWLRDDAAARAEAGRRARARAEALSWPALTPTYARVYTQLAGG